MLVEAGFSTRNPDDLIYDQHRIREGIYYDTRTWARKKGDDNREPLFAAATMSIKWTNMRQIYNLNMPLVQEVDGLTELPAFMLAAIGHESDMESVYNLLKEYPPAISFQIDRYRNPISGKEEVKSHKSSRLFMVFAVLSMFFALLVPRIVTFNDTRVS